MTSTSTANPSDPSGCKPWKHLISGLFVLLGSLLATMQSQHMNPPYTFDFIQTRVDAFVR